MDGVETEPLFLNKLLIKGLMWQNLSLLFEAIDSEEQATYIMRYVKLARNVKLFVHRHNKGQSGTMHPGSVYCAS